MPGKHDLLGPLQFDNFCDSLVEIGSVPFHGNWHMTLVGPITSLFQWAGMEPSQSECFPGVFQSEASMQVPFPLWS